MLSIVLILIVVFAIASIQTDSLRNSIIYLSVFSLLCSFAYALYHAPDVAIAEVVIGCTLSTVLYLVAIKKYRIFRAFYSNQVTIPSKIPETNVLRNNLITIMDGFLREHELELDFINTKYNFDDVDESHDYDIYIEHTNNGVKIYGSKSNYIYSDLVNYLNEHNAFPIDYEYIIEEIGDPLL